MLKLGYPRAFLQLRRRRSWSARRQQRWRQAGRQRRTNNEQRQLLLLLLGGHALRQCNILNPAFLCKCITAAAAAPFTTSVELFKAVAPKAPWSLSPTHKAPGCVTGQRHPSCLVPGEGWRAKCSGCRLGFRESGRQACLQKQALGTPATYINRVNHEHERLVTNVNDVRRGPCSSQEPKNTIFATGTTGKNLLYT